MSKKTSYTVEIVYEGKRLTVNVMAAPNSVMGTVYEKYPGCDIIRIY